MLAARADAAVSPVPDFRTCLLSEPSRLNRGSIPFTRSALFCGLPVTQGRYFRQAGTDLGPTGFTFQVMHERNPGSVGAVIPFPLVKAFALPQCYGATRG
jgi:hypothetical protein